ncbi:MAG: peptide ABC transporter substrate-binding protein [Alphaproteobacteria bacterium]|nr:peptide ABC transporter substrate-binding protein [Alphaproteobacteria bacterium]
MFIFNINTRKIAKTFMLVLCLAITTPTHADHNNLKIGMSQYPSTLHPMFDSMVAKSYVLGATLRPLAAYAADWKPMCLLCTVLPSFENGRAIKTADGKIEATYHLKDGLAWADGTPLTAKDFVFAWEVGKHPKSGASNADLYTRDIADIRIEDDKTFTVVFAKQQCEFAALADFYPLPEHLERAVFEKDPATYINRTLYNTKPATPGLHMGPYKIADVKTGSAIKIDKNAHWAGKAPAFETVTFRTIENSSSLSANLLSGDIDYIAGELGLLLDEALDFEKRLNKTKPGQYTVTYKPGLTYEHIDLPLDRPPFNNHKLRQALIHAIDREGLNTALFDGQQKIAHSNINPLDTVYDPNVTLYPYDPAKAEALLDEAGWKRGADGLRAEGNGRRLSITLYSTAGNKTRATVAQAIQSYWQKIGIDAHIQMLPARVLFGEIMRKRMFDGGVMYAWMSSPRNIPRSTLHGTMVPSEKNNYAGQNYPGYKNPAMDYSLNELEVVCEKNANQKLWSDIQSIYASDLPALPLYFRANAFIVPTWLKGITPTGHMHPTTFWIEDWNAAP